MSKILESILQGLIQWLYSLILEMVEYVSNTLLDVFRMDLNYFISIVPIFDSIFNVLIITGWALLLGNLAFQAMKSMVAGIGIDGEDPRLLFTRTFLFSFLLLASRQICNIGLNLSHSVITLLEIPDVVVIHTPDEAGFSTGAAWLLAIIIGFVIIWQVFKMFMELGERYVLVAFLTLFSPLAFAMGGSESTKDIFKGWVRMFASMCVLMVSHIVFLKTILSAMAYCSQGLDAVPWAILIVGIARVSRKFDDIINRIGLNAASTGGGLGKVLPGSLSYAVMRGMSGKFSAAFGKGVSTPKGGRGAAVPPSASNGDGGATGQRGSQSAQNAAAGNFNTTTESNSAHQKNDAQNGQSPTRQTKAESGSRPSYVSAGNPSLSHAERHQNPKTAQAEQHSNPAAVGGVASSHQSTVQSTQMQQGAASTSSGSSISSRLTNVNPQQISQNNSTRQENKNTQRISANPAKTSQFQTGANQNSTSAAQTAGESRSSNHVKAQSTSQSGTSAFARDGRNPNANTSPAENRASLARDGRKPDASMQVSSQKPIPEPRGGRNPVPSPTSEKGSTSPRESRNTFSRATSIPEPRQAAQQGDGRNGVNPSVPLTFSTQPMGRQERDSSRLSQAEPVQQGMAGIKSPVTGTAIPPEKQPKHTTRRIPDVPRKKQKIRRSKKDKRKR